MPFNPGPLSSSQARDLDRIAAEVERLGKLAVVSPLEIQSTPGGDIVSIDIPPEPVVLVSVLLRPASPPSTVYLQPYGNPFFDATVRVWDDATATFTNPQPCLAVSAFAPGPRGTVPTPVTDYLDIGQYVGERIPGAGRDGLPVYLVRHRDACFFSITTAASGGFDNAQGKLIRYSGSSPFDPANPLAQNLSPNATTIYNASTYSVGDVVAALPVRVGSYPTLWRAVQRKVGLDLSVSDQSLSGGSLTITARTAFAVTAMEFVGDGWTTTGGAASSIRLNKVNGLMYGVINGVTDTEIRFTGIGGTSLGYMKDLQCFDPASLGTVRGAGVSANIGFFRQEVYGATFKLVDQTSIASNLVNPIGANARYDRNGIGFSPLSAYGSAGIGSVLTGLYDLAAGLIGYPGSNVESWYTRVQTGSSTFWESYIVPGSSGGFVLMPGGIFCQGITAGGFVAKVTTPGSGVVTFYPGIDTQWKVGEKTYISRLGLVTEVTTTPPGSVRTPITRRLT